MSLDNKAIFFDGTEDIESGTTHSLKVFIGEKFSDPHIPIVAQVTEDFEQDEGDNIKATGTITVSGTPLVNVDATGTITVSGTPLIAVANVDATGTITITGTPIAEETFVVGEQTFTFVASGTDLGNVVIDANNTTQAANIVTSITRDLATVTATNTEGVVNITSVAHGTAGNSIVLTENATGVAVSGSGMLEGGVDAVAADTFVVGAQTFTFVSSGTETGNVVQSEVNATQAANIVTSITRDLTTVTATREDAVVTVTAVAHGTAGNSIVLTENATGIAVSGSGTLAGGVNADTFVVGAQTFTFVSSGTATGNVVQSAVNATQAANIVTSVNRDLATVVATRTDAVVTITAATGGTAGNSITLTESATGIAVSAGGHLTGGLGVNPNCELQLKLLTCATESGSYTTVLADTGLVELALLKQGYKFKLGSVPAGCLGYLMVDAIVTAGAEMSAGHIKVTISEGTVSSTVSPTNPPTGTRL